MNRRQASLYLNDAPHVEALRLRYNPDQARLIPAHVTLCREDEVTDWELFRRRLESLCPFRIQLAFGAPLREGDFVFLPALNGLNGLDGFHEFRRVLLQNEPRRHQPHVTIIHPRNGICSDEIFAEISSRIEPIEFIFQEVMLIEQENCEAWKLVARVGS